MAIIVERPKRTRKRTLVIREGVSTSSSGSTFSYKFTSGQKTIDSLNQWPPEKSGANGMFDRGGNFFSQTVDYSDNARVWDKSFGTSWYKGPVFPKLSSVDAWSPSHQSQTNFSFTPQGDLEELGAVAMARCSPVNAHAQATVALGELLRDGLPSIPGWQSIRLRPGALGGEFLNYQFGIKPTISDIRALREAVDKSEKIIRQYHRDSGRRVRRSFRFPDETSTTVTRQEFQGVTPAPPSALWSKNYGTLWTTTTTTRKRWFSGMCTYHAQPPADQKSVYGGFQKFLDDANRVYGLRLDPAAAWNLLPWSWLVDWFTNADDVLTNASQAMYDQLVWWYGYIMETTIRDVTYTMLGGPVWKDGQEVHPLWQRIVYTTKQRYESTPFGFGVELGNLDARQFAILASLGITSGGKYAAM